MGGNHSSPAPTKTVINGTSFTPHASGHAQVIATDIGLMNMYDMGILQNLAAVTPVHWIKSGLCFELAVPDGMVHKALTAAGAAGKCSESGYTQFDYDKKIEVPVEGEVEFGVW